MRVFFLQRAAHSRIMARPDVEEADDRFFGSKGESKKDSKILPNSIPGLAGTLSPDSRDFPSRETRISVFL